MFIIYSVHTAEIIVLATAISIDAFCAAFSYGTNNIKIPLRSILTIHILSLTFICIAMCSGVCLTGYLTEKAVAIISFLLLFFIGIFKLFDVIIKNALLKTENCKKDISFSLMSLKFILSVYADPKTADADCSKILSATEAAILAVTLSADSLPIGIGMGLSDFPIWLVILIVLITDEFALRMGQFCGKKAAKKLRRDISWMGGALLIIIAFMKLN